MKEKDLCPSLFVILTIVRARLKEENSEQNDILVLFTFMLSYKLTTAPQIQRRSFPIVHSQIRKLKHVGVLNLER